MQNFATAVWARKVRPDVMVPIKNVTQIVDIFSLVCQTDLTDRDPIWNSSRSANLRKNLAQYNIWSY